jgi:hypothetical protein
VAWLVLGCGCSSRVKGTGRTEGRADTCRCALKIKSNQIRAAAAMRGHTHLHRRHLPVTLPQATESSWAAFEQRCGVRCAGGPGGAVLRACFPCTFPACTLSRELHSLTRRQQAALPGWGMLHGLQLRARPLARCTARWAHTANATTTHRLLHSSGANLSPSSPPPSHRLLPTPKSAFSTQR